MTDVAALFIAAFAVILVACTARWITRARELRKVDEELAEMSYSDMSNHPSMKGKATKISHQYYVRVPYIFYALARESGTEVHSRSARSVHAEENA